MSGASLEKRKAYLAVGGAGVFFAAGYLGLSVQLPLGQLARPGAAIYPILAGSLLLVGSVAALIEGWKLKRDERIDVPTGPDLWRLLGLVGVLLAYFLVLPWLGQLLSSTLFCIVLMRILSDLSWPGIVLRSVAITVPAYFVFIHLIKVPMPRGVLF